MRQPEPVERERDASEDARDSEAESARRRVTVDDTSRWSFPASDPPATWTWDVEPASSES